MSGASPTARASRPFLGGWHLVLPIVALAAARDLWAPDEPRYAQIAREAFESGSLLVLHICGDLYPDKPPLVYWLAGLAGELSGWSAFAMRVPSILATIGSAWIAARIARRLLGDVAAAWTPAFYLGTAMVLWLGGRLQLDPLLAFFCLAAVDLAWTDGGTARERTRRLLLAGLCAGLGALCKGPVAWLPVGLALVALRAVPRAARTPAPFGALAWAGFVALAILPVATWATAAALREPALWKQLFFAQHLGRATSGEAPHHGPPWEHAWQMPLFLLPFTGLFALGLAAAIRAWRRSRAGETPTAPERGLVRALTWFALVFVAFSAIPAKRELYLLPIYPAAAWLAAVAFERALASGRVPYRIAGATTALCFACGLVAGTVPHLVEDARPYATAAMPVALAFVAAAGASFAFLRRNDLARWADSILLGLSGAGLAGAIWVLPLVDPVKSARELALAVAALPQKPAEIPCISVQPEGYRFYGGVPTVRARTEDLAAALDAAGPQFLALITQKSLDKLPAELRARVVVLVERQVGSRDVVVVGAAR